MVTNYYNDKKLQQKLVVINIIFEIIIILSIAILSQQSS